MQPNADGSAVVTMTITSDGRHIPADYAFVSLQTLAEFNRVPWAAMVFADDAPADQSFPVSDGTYFALGATVKIEARRGDAGPTSVFEGVVVRHRLAVTGGRGAQLSIELRGQAITLVRTRSNRVWKQRTDAEVMQNLISDAGLRADVSVTGIRGSVHPQLVQYGSTDWDFLVERAEAIGRVVVTTGPQISVLEMNKVGPPDLTVSRGVSEVYAFDLEADGMTQYSGIEANAWDATGLEVQPVTARQQGPMAGNFLPAQVAGKIGPATLSIGNAQATPEEVRSWADATNARNQGAFLRGTISIPGAVEIHPGSTIALTGFGDRFSGRLQVTGVSHRIDSDGWRVDVQVGIKATSLAESTAVEGPGAAGLLPPIRGLQIGVVTGLDPDGSNPDLVEVSLAAFGAGTKILARLALPDAGSRRGHIFRPEPGDEVVVGFINDDPRQAVLLGGLYGPRNDPPAGYNATKENNAKAIVSRKGTVLGFLDADKPSVFIKTPAGNTVELSDDAQSVKVADQHGNSVVLSESGVSISTKKDFNVSADGAVTIKGASVDLG